MRHEPASVARCCYAAIRQLREENGLPRGPVWNLLVKTEQDWWVRSAERAGWGMLPKEIFDAWADDLTMGGDQAERWRYGPEVDHAKRTHPLLTGWYDLPEAVRRQFIVVQMVSVGMNVAVPEAAIAG